MPEYIKLESALQIVSDVMSDCKVLHKHRAINRNLKQIPTADAVAVVRCKDCISYEERFGGCGYCYHWEYEQGESPNRVDEDDFCSYGERRVDV